MKKVAIIGGTHGNELTGIRLVQKWRDNEDIVTRDSLDIRLEYGNPAAIKAKARFVEEDLNRAFHIDDLRNGPGTSLESQRAYQLNDQLGPKFGAPKVDVIIDLHTTTANMGNTIIIYNDPYNLKMAKYIQAQEPTVHVYISDKAMKDTVALQSVAPRGMLLEIGPIPQGVLYHKQFEDMERIAQLALDFIDRSESDPTFDVTGPLEVFQRGTLVSYPTNDSGDIIAMLHKDIQDMDYCQLNPGDPIFMTFDGKTLYYEGAPGFPVFINEAAYYEANVAFRMNNKMTLNIEPKS